MLSRHVMSAAAVFLLLLSLQATPQANAQEWPTKQTIKVIVPFTAGSTTDIIGRTVYEQVGRQIGQTVVIENRGGAGTTIGTTGVATSEPDGYTLLVASASLSVIATTYTKLPFKVADDLAGISILADVPFTVGTMTKYKTMKEFVDHAKSKDGAINYGTAGNGSAGHLFMEWLAINAGYKSGHVPFRGTPEALTEIVANRLDVYPIPVANGVELFAANKINALAVSAKRRAPLLPNVPTLAEVGLEKAIYNFWVGTFAPRKTPAAILTRLNKEVVAALKDKSVIDRIIALGGDPRPMTPAETDAFLKQEIAVNARIITAAGVKLVQ